MNISNEEQKELLQLKSLLNHLSYMIKDEDRWVIENFHKFCRKYCSYQIGGKNEKTD